MNIKTRMAEPVTEKVPLLTKFENFTSTNEPYLETVVQKLGKSNKLSPRFIVLHEDQLIALKVVHYNSDTVF